MDVASSGPCCTWSDVHGRKPPTAAGELVLSRIAAAAALVARFLGEAQVGGGRQSGMDGDGNAGHENSVKKARPGYRDRRKSGVMMKTSERARCRFGPESANLNFFKCDASPQPETLFSRR